MPALIKRAHEAKLSRASSICVWGDGSQTRDLLYAPDAAKWTRKALESDVNNQMINLGSGVSTSIKDLIEMIKLVTGYSGKVLWDTTKPVGASKRLLDISLAETLLGYGELTDLEQGLAATYRDFVERSAA